MYVQITEIFEISIFGDFVKLQSLFLLFNIEHVLQWRALNERNSNMLLFFRFFWFRRRKRFFARLTVQCNALSCALLLFYFVLLVRWLYICIIKWSSIFAPDIEMRFIRSKSFWPCTAWTNTQKNSRKWGDETITRRLTWWPGQNVKNIYSI